MSKWNDIETLLRRVHFATLKRYPLLVVFYTGAGGPPDCVPMARAPNPDRGFDFGDDFESRVQEALAINDSAHDGAVVFGRREASEPYVCVGWSHRIVANQNIECAEPNRGAAYNSAICLSTTLEIDGVCLFSQTGTEIFVRGKKKVLS